MQTCLRKWPSCSHLRTLAGRWATRTVVSFSEQALQCCLTAVQQNGCPAGWEMGAGLRASLWRDSAVSCATSPYVARCALCAHNVCLLSSSDARSCWQYHHPLAYGKHDPP